MDKMRKPTDVLLLREDGEGGVVEFTARDLRQNNAYEDAHEIASGLAHAAGGIFLFTYARIDLIINDPY